MVILAAQSEPPTPASVESAKVRKTHFSNHTRFLFVAGLEGSGHHAFQMLLEPCLRSGLCQGDANLTTALHGRPASGEQSGAFVLDTPPELRDVRLQLVHERLQQHSPGEGKSQVELVVLNTIVGEADLCCGSGTQRLCSGVVPYPSLMGLQRTLHMPDLFSLAQWAEAAGTDLRVLVVRRNAKDSLLSTIGSAENQARHRTFGSWMQQGAVLTNAGSSNRRLLEPVTRTVDPPACRSTHPVMSSRSVSGGATFATRATRPVLLLVCLLRAAPRRACRCRLVDSSFPLALIPASVAREIQP